ncbi:MAG: DUF3429 domain-containing protein [Gammaproteobacteria bacterium]
MNKSRLATVLGYAGLVPFVVATAMLFTDNASLGGPALYSLTVYAAIILAFMGAIHWGVAMQSNAQSSGWQLGLSVVPALVAWLSLSVQSPRDSLLTLAVAFGAILIADLYAVSKFLVPTWYRRLRVPLSLVVIGCLCIAAWRIA